MVAFPYQTSEAFIMSSVALNSGCFIVACATFTLLPASSKPTVNLISLGSFEYIGSILMNLNSGGLLSMETFFEAVNEFPSLSEAVISSTFGPSDSRFESYFDLQLIVLPVVQNMVCV